MDEITGHETRKLRTRIHRLLLPDWETRKRMLRVEGWVALGLAYATLVFAYFFPQDFRNTSPAYGILAWASFMARAFVFHGGLAVGMLLIAAAGARQWKLAAAAVPLALFACGPAALSWLPRTVPPTSSAPLRVMVMNLNEDNREMEAALAEIRSAKPDLLFLLEYTFDTDRALRTELQRDMPHTTFVSTDDAFGMGVFSRKPFAERPRNVTLSDGSVTHKRVVVPIEGRPVAFYGLHLYPPRFTNRLTHRLQTADVLDLVRAEPLPCVLAGDFNFPESAPNAAKIRAAGFCDAHKLGGCGRGSTWPVRPDFMRWVPGLQLDHIYAGPGLACTRCRTGIGKGSDHRPVIADLQLLYRPAQ